MKLHSKRKPSPGVELATSSDIGRKKLRVQIKNAENQVIESIDQVEVPAQFSQLAADIVATKYFRRIDSKKNETPLRETSFFQVVERIDRALSQQASRSGIFKNRNEVRSFAKSIRIDLLRQRAAFNSPVFFNYGLFEMYGIKTAQGISETGQGSRPQTSACFIQGVEDDLDSIFDLLRNEARIFKYGSGTGTNFSKIRGKGAPLSNGGTSSGLIRILDFFDRAASAIKSGGITRRAAKMVCLDEGHPDLLEFIDWKWNEEKKAKALMAQGYSADPEGEAYRTVSGQNANVSVRLTDSFFKKLEKASDNRKSSPEKNIMSKLAHAAWACGDPGVQFHDTIQKWHTCKASGPIRASNPCSEFMFLDDTACNLASINLVHFLDQDQSFKVEDFVNTVQTWITAQEILVSNSGYPTSRIAKNSERYRPLGLGFANLGGLLMRMGIAYDSEQGRAIAGAITSLMTASAYRQSHRIAKKRGPFAGYKKNHLHMIEVMRLHQRAHLKLRSNAWVSPLLEKASEYWAEVVHVSKTVGFRNAQVTVLAPTGTIGLMMDCDTTGIEPDYSLIKEKKLSGGGRTRIVNQSVAIGLRTLGYSEQDIQSIVAWIEKNGTVVGSVVKPVHYPVFDCAIPPEGLAERRISIDGHLLMMAALQPFLSGAISKTINCPHETSVEGVQDIFIKAWKLGLKSVAIYRDGSKGAQPLMSQASAQLESRQVSDVLFAPTQETCPKCGQISAKIDACFRCFNCGTTMGCG